MSIYEEVEIEDMKYDPETKSYYYPCPCGDRFVISHDDLLDGEDVATCPSCTLRIRVIYDIDALPAEAPGPENNSSNNSSNTENTNNESSQSEAAASKSEDAADVTAAEESAKNDA